VIQRLQQFIADATHNAPPGQLKLITYCAVIAAAYAVLRTLYLLWKFLKQTPQPLPAPARTAPAAAIGQQPVSGVDPKLIVILTAAATAAMGGRKVAIRRITFINHNTISGWAEAGRIGIHGSHNIRRMS